MVITLDPINKGSNVTLKNDNMTAVIVDAFGTARASIGRSSGKWYYEITFESLNNAMVNVITSASVGTTYNLTTSRGYYSSTGTKWSGAQSISLPYGTAFKAGDTVGVNLNLDGGVLTFYVNGANQGVAFTDLKTLGTLFPAITSGSSTGGSTATFNFGATPFKYPPTDIKYKTLSYDGSRMINSTNKTLILHDGEYKKFTPKLIGKDSTTNVVPHMTSNTSPTGKVTARGAYNPAWQAFDKNDSTYWYDNGSNAGAPSWLQYQFDSPKMVNKIILASQSISGSTYGLKEFSLLGSRDGLNYDNLLSVNNHPNSSAKVIYDFNNSNEYSFYKLQFGLSHFSYYALVSSFEMYEMDTPDIPAYWSTVSTTLPTSTKFQSEGMDNLSSLLDRTVTELESLPMTNKSEILNEGEVGKVFSKTIDLKKYIDIRSIKVEVK
ncbi:SPRY domain-containing protein [Lysinibacillus parviboronicapiens]|uniref:SPRY domain-containing protein n=1 Tax=Lysinibacillus parviboronicapiens TaxID=436516 RepID=UPI000D337D38|nr:SPRY domain-containing protein [Lysinibacillus parviboronicapiens]